ncbi:MAG: TonB family protein [Pseudomonadota bacterium]
MRVVFLTIACLILLMPAFAQDLSAAIRDYNAAQESGDPAAKVAAASTLGAAAISAPAREDTPILVFEAVQTLTLNSAQTDTSELIEWLDAATFPEGGPIAQIDVDLLVSYARWTQDPNKASRQAFDEALAAVSKLEPTLLTLFSFQKRYVADLESGALKKLPGSALTAAQHFAPVKHVLGESWSSATIIAHSAAFNRSTEEESLYAMAGHFVELEKIHAEMHEADTEHPEWVDRQRHLAETWFLAMEAFFQSERANTRGKAVRREERLDGILNWRPEEAARYPGAHEDELQTPGQLPLCAGRFDMKPNMRYPSRAARKGRVGAVLLSFDITNGRVTDAESLAAIPNQGFAEDSIKTLRKWTWIVDEDVDREACGLDAKNVRMPFTFVLN